MKVGITGSKGFIGSALKKKCQEFAKVYPYPRKDLDYLFLFGSPSSNILFDQNLDYCMEETINSFLNAIQFCRDNKIKLIYPSSATIYNKNNSYSRCKAILEEIHQSYGGDVLGLRIFAGYGPGEGHKGEYASVVYKFCQEMKAGKSPVIFGDGTQTRDFVYIDDIVEIIWLLKHQKDIIDIGTGVNTSFNELIKIINFHLKTKIKPIYVKKPKQYMDETSCPAPRICSVSISEGIERILKSL